MDRLLRPSHQWAEQLRDNDAAFAIPTHTIPFSGLSGSRGAIAGDYRMPMLNHYPGVHYGAPVAAFSGLALTYKVGSLPVSRRKSHNVSKRSAISFAWSCV